MRVPLPFTAFWSNEPVSVFTAVWTVKDRLVLEALQHYEDSLCGSCSQSGFHTYVDEDGNNMMNELKYRVDSIVCLTCAMKEQVSEDNPVDKGEKLFVVDLGGQP